MGKNYPASVSEIYGGGGVCASMVLIATDILGDLVGLSLGLLIAVIPVGLTLALFGWWSHRFWIVLATTVLAGVFGLLEAGTWKAQPIVVAVLLAVAAGVLALALVRVITFAAGGFAGAYLLGLGFPAWNQPILCFLISGLVCLLLFRWFFMALTSFLGSALLAYGTLALLHYHDVMDAVVWAGENAMLLNILCGAGTLLGFAFQVRSERRRLRKLRESEEDDEEEDGVGTLILAKIGLGGKSKRDAA